MHYRQTIKDLTKWKNKENRKPLVLRGARQVGKTTLVDLFSDTFDQYIYLNLEIKEDLQLFQSGHTIENLISAIFFYKGKQRDKKETLIFIDEIQNSPEAVQQLRFFYENAHDLYIIAAGSLLESLIDNSINFPVGRVEYMFLKPFSFFEYLLAVEGDEFCKIFETIPLPKFAHDKLIKHFNTYTLIGGMPEVVSTYASTNDILSLQPIFESLLTSYLDDVEKYARNQTLTHVIRHVISTSYYNANSRIKFQGFGNSPYKSREVGEAFRTLEKAMLLHLIYPTTATEHPALPDLKKSPKLQLLDTGLVNYFAGLQKEIYGTDSIHKVYKGNIAEHITGQELLTLNNSITSKLSFWVREKKQSNAEVDFLINYDNMVIPIEVKSGASGSLRSLGLFMDQCPHNFAVRVYSGTLSVEQTKTINGKAFTLLNLPFYLIGFIREYINWFIQGGKCQ